MTPHARSNQYIKKPTAVFMSMCYFFQMRLNSKQARNHKDFLVLFM